MPTVKEVVEELLAIVIAIDWSDIEEDDDGERYVDVRLQVYPNGDWYVHYGDPCYDTDLRGYWGAATLTPDTDDLVTVAEDLLGQCFDEEDCPPTDRNDR